MRFNPLSALTPKAPKLPPAPAAPTRADPAVEEARRRQLIAANVIKGRTATVLAPKQAHGG